MDYLGIDLARYLRLSPDRSQSQLDCFAVSIIDDLFDEDDEMFYVKLTSEYTELLLTSTTVTIVDDGKPHK